MSDVIEKSELFRRLGYGDSHDLIELVLEDAGLSRPSKRAISVVKQPAVEALLAEHFVAVCSRGDCKNEAMDERETRIVVSATSSAHCEICQGSASARAVDEMVEGLRTAGLARLCVVGGSPNTRTKLATLVGDRLELRLIDGTTARTTAQAKNDLAWADLVAIWGATMLDHKVSKHYKGPHVIQFARRGIRELVREILVAIENDSFRRGHG